MVVMECPTIMLPPSIWITRTLPMSYTRHIRRRKHITYNYIRHYHHLRFLLFSVSFSGANHFTSCVRASDVGGCTHLVDERKSLMKSFSVKSIGWMVLFVTFSAIFLSDLSAQVTWTWLSPTPQGNLLIDLQALDDNTVIAVGNNSTVLRTSNGGQHWDVKYRVGGTDDYLTDVVFNNSGIGLAVGENGKVLTTADSGKTWSVHSIGAPSFLWEVEFIQGQTWFAVSYGVLYKTTDN